MPQQAEGSVTRLLSAWTGGEPRALESLMPLVYEELRRIAHRQLGHERPSHTLQPPDLVSEAYLRLVGRPGSSFRNRAHFFGICARLMRQILVDHARRRLAEKRGSGREAVPLTEVRDWPQAAPAVDVLALEEALEALERLDERQARVVELRFYAGLEIEETAEALGLSTATVKREWRMARAWLLRRLSDA